MKSRSLLLNIRYFSSKIIKPSKSKHSEDRVGALKYPLMTRDFIRDRLYGEDDGYFQKKDNQVGILTEPIQFK